jgi:integrase
MPSELCRRSTVVEDLQVFVALGIRPWTEEHARSFLRAAVNHRLYALFAVAISLGLRGGELLGPRWSDVDLDARG